MEDLDLLAFLEAEQPMTRVVPDQPDARRDWNRSGEACRDHHP